MVLINAMAYTRLSLMKQISLSPSRLQCQWSQDRSGSVGLTCSGSYSFSALTEEPLNRAFGGWVSSDNSVFVNRSSYRAPPHIRQTQTSPMAISLTSCAIVKGVCHVSRVLIAALIDV